MTGREQPWPGTFRPVPVIQLNGVDVASGLGSSLVALDGVSVRWGRERVLDQPTAATATVTLFDTSGSLAASRQLIGQPLIIRWYEPTFSVLQPVYFRGRVTATEVRRMRGGLAITLTCASAEADLANAVVFGAVWPAETIAARRARILAAAPDLLASIVFPSGWDATSVAPATVDGRSVAELITELYNSVGLRYRYDPEYNSINYVARRNYQFVTSLAGLDTGRGRGNNAGATATDDNPDGSANTPSHWIDGAALLDPDVAWSEDVGTRINRVVLSYLDAAATPAYAQKRIGRNQAAGAGARTLSVTSILSAAPSAGTAADDWLSAATSEGAQVVLAPFVLDTHLTDGFPTREQAMVWLAGQERPDLFIISNSWLPSEGFRPVFGIMGGSIDYRAGGWTVTANPSPAYVGTSGAISPPPQKQQFWLSWPQTVASSVRAARPIAWTRDRPTPAQWALDPALTYDDTRYLSWGVGASHADPAAAAFDYDAYAATHGGMAP